MFYYLSTMIFFILFNLLIDVKITVLVHRFTQHCVKLRCFGNTPRCADCIESFEYSITGRLAHSGPLQGVGELSQGCCSCSWPQNKHQEECSLPFSTNCVFESSLGFRSNAGPSGSCLDFQPQYMFGPLQARPSCLHEHLLQALRPHGCSLPSGCST